MGATKARRIVQPRTKSDYDPKAMKESQSGGGMWAHCFNPKIKTMVFTPAGKNMETTWFRPLPPMDCNDPNNVLASGRLSTDDGDFSHWQRAFRVVRYAGIDDPTCIPVTYVIGGARDQNAWTTDPFCVLYSACRSAKKAGKFGTGRVWSSSWNRFMEGKKGEGEELPSPKLNFFIQAAMLAGFTYTEGEKTYTNFMKENDTPYGLREDDPLCIVSLTEMTGKKLIAGDLKFDVTAILDLKRKDHDPTSDDYNAVFRAGDPTGTFDPETMTVSGGIFVGAFYPKKKAENPAFCSWDGKIGTTQSYEVRCSGKFNAGAGRILSPSLTVEQTEEVFNHFTFFEESAPGVNDGLINTLSMEERASLVARAFRKAGRMLQFAWLGNPEFMTDDVKGILGERASSVAPLRDETDEQTDEQEAGDDAADGYDPDDTEAGDVASAHTVKKDTTVKVGRNPIAGIQADPGADAGYDDEGGEAPPDDSESAEDGAVPGDDAEIEGGGELPAEDEPPAEDGEPAAEGDEEPVGEAPVEGDDEIPEASVSADAEDVGGVDDADEPPAEPAPRPAPRPAARPAAAPAARPAARPAAAPAPAPRPAAKPAAAPAPAAKPAARPAAAPAARPAAAPAPKPAARPAAAPAPAAKPAARPAAAPVGNGKPVARPAAAVPTGKRTAAAASAGDEDYFGDPAGAALAGVKKGTGKQLAEASDASDGVESDLTLAAQASEKKQADSLKAAAEAGSRSAPRTSPKTAVPAAKKPAAAAAPVASKGGTAAKKK